MGEADLLDPPALHMELSFDFSNAYPDILLLTGTQTGNAETVAEAVAAMLDAHGFAPTVRSMMDTDMGDLDAVSQLIVITSTYGEGELPDTAHDFHAALNETQPDLSHLAYGVIALGDSHYAHFANGGRLMDAALAGCQALPVLPIHTIDQGPTRAQLEEAMLWAMQCAEAFSEAFAEDE
ncbi:MAG: hypothetical protein RhofKO_29110 [Rhodothermales bacterium]